MFKAKKLPSQETKNRFRNEATNTPNTLLWKNVVIESEAQKYESLMAESPFSILSLDSSSVAHINHQKKSYKICQNTCFILAPYESISYTIDETMPTKVLNLHLSYETYLDYVRNSSTQTEKLLDDPYLKSTEIPFANHLYNKPEHLGYLLKNIENGDPDYNLLNILNLSLEISEQNKTLYRNLKELKSNTRSELFKRMLIARDIIYSCYDNPGLDLDQLSAAVYMSKFHFLRVFKQTFQITPYQMLRSVRIEKIRELAALHIDKSEIALKVGILEPNSIYALLKEPITCV